ncbi:MAG: hypothetical protein OJF59_000578 [Cytophagales bacterium]|jgi:hypothetical protein|nr:hypothetical protein [Bacteroidota bacterium]WHZ06825.1 MAG: hypothetical protein OJF59_000578 [Cytophagales bacterium]
MESAIKVIADPNIKEENIVISYCHPVNIDTIKRPYLQMAKRHGMIEASAMHSAIHVTELKDNAHFASHHDNTVNKFICAYKNKYLLIGVEVDQNLLGRCFVSEVGIHSTNGFLKQRSYFQSIHELERSINKFFNTGSTITIKTKRK